MANLAFAGEKATREEVKRELMLVLADNWAGAFTVDFHSDDGGHILRAVIECEDPDQQLDQVFTDKLPLKFMGWRLVILKVPIGHVKVFYS